MIYSDGGARGNPGPAAIAFRALSESEQIVNAGSSFIGVKTNNQAEYEALIMALEFVITLNAEEVVCHLDSELVTKQLNREYRVKNADLLKLWNKVQAIKRNFKKITFKHVPRSNMEIQKVDALVNKTLDLEESVNYKGL
jgi:ribonuclease HI